MGTLQEIAKMLKWILQAMGMKNNGRESQEKWLAKGKGHNL
jgi:hypothetical protein